MRDVDMSLMSDSPCPDSEFLAQYLDGGLSTADRDGVERHLTACPTCRAVALDAPSVEAELRRHELPSPSGTVVEPVFPRFRKSLPFPLLLPRSVAAGAIAATAVVAIAISLATPETPSSRTGPTAPRPHDIVLPQRSETAALRSYEALRPAPILDAPHIQASAAPAPPREMIKRAQPQFRSVPSDARRLPQYPGADADVSKRLWSAEITKLFNEGVAAANSGDHRAALTAFSNAAAVMPSCTDCYFNIGVSQRRMGDFVGAETAFKKSIELRPNNPQAYIALAELYTSQKEMNLAAAASAKAADLLLADAGGDAAALYAAGIGLWNANKYPEASATFEAAVKADASHAGAHFMLGKVYMNLGELKEAATEFGTYLTLQPSGTKAAEAAALYQEVTKFVK